MSQTVLVARIAALKPPSPAAWFALLSTYYTPARLRDAENRLVAKGIRPLRLPEAPLGELGHEELRAGLATLHGHASNPAAFDKYALGMLKALDRTLYDLTAGVLDAEIVTGFDDRRYRVRQLQNPIAVHAGRGLPPEARQGTLSAYSHRMVIVPADPMDEGCIECLRIESRAPPVYKRLLAARDDLSIGLCPLQGPIDYPVFDTPRPAFVVLKDPRNERDLLNQIEQAIDTASAECATMLIFPELAFSPAMLAAAQARLAAHGAGGHPILTVAGLCHAPHGSDGSHLNEAVVLGPDGQELHRHRKLSRYTDERGTPEHITTGSTLAVLETPCGHRRRPSASTCSLQRARRCCSRPMRPCCWCPRSARRSAPTGTRAAPSRRIAGAAPSCAIAPSRASMPSHRVSTGRRYRTPRTNTMVQRRSYGSGWPSAGRYFNYNSSVVPYRLTND